MQGFGVMPSGLFSFSMIMITIHTCHELHGVFSELPITNHEATEDIVRIIHVFFGDFRHMHNMIAFSDSRLSQRICTARNKDVP